MLDAAKLELLWGIARTCGPAKELVRVRAFLESTYGATRLVPENPYQRPTITYFPGLTARAWHDPADFPWTERLVDAFHTIREEVDHVASRRLHSSPKESLTKGHWNILHLNVMGVRTAVGRLLCPQTSQLTSELTDGGEVGMIFLSGLGSDTHVQRHYGGTNTRLRCHLGLRVPAGCTIRVGDEERAWQERGILVFDDSFDHEVWNRSSETRWVLIVDFWHPELTLVERRALARLSHFRSKERRLRARRLRMEKHIEREARRQASMPEVGR